MSKNKVAEKQYEALKSMGDASPIKKVSKLSTYLMILCSATFVTMLTLKLTKTVEINWFLTLIPLISIVPILLIAFVIVTIMLMKKGMINPRAIKEEESKMMRQRSKTYRDAEKAYKKMPTKKSGKQ